MKVLVAFLGSLLILGCQNTVPTPEGYRLDWNDEFEVAGAPDSDIWNFEVLPPGTYNRELQAYTSKPENARVENGVLVIEALPIPGTTRGYTSARLTTQFKKDIFEGRIEVRAKLPSAKGSWPAIWFLPVSTDGRYGWPHSGEIDLMEFVGYQPGIIHSSVHTSKYNWSLGNNFTRTLSVPTASTEFRTYILEWTEEALDFYVDDQFITQYPNEGTGWEAWPFDVPFYLLLNLAVGGEWGGAEGVDREAFPDRMEVDYVRVYSRR
ncbi:MAG: glycoside hydrolase family 16 protein [Spirochaetales bacterium]|nr:glycoside hydrolase family 16 protein [Spirochaetales bacterium]